MAKLRECVKECSFEKPDEVVKFLFLMHNQNAHVHEELLKSMKDEDGLNDILDYAHLVEGTQHSESLSKAYLDTIKISSVKVDAIVQKKNNHNNKFHGRHKGSKHKLQSKGDGNCHNCGTSHPLKCCPAYGKTCYNCNKKGQFKPLCRSHQCSQSGSRWKGSQSQSQSRKDQHEISSCDQTDDSNWYACEQDSIQIVYNKGIREISLTFASMR